MSHSSEKLRGTANAGAPSQVGGCHTHYGATHGYSPKKNVSQFWDYKAVGWVGRVLDHWVSYNHTETSLHRCLGNLPEPDWLTYRFW